MSYSDDLPDTCRLPSVGYLLESLRTSLAVLLPIADAADLGWDGTRAYDEWDGVADALYRAFVVSACEDGLDGPAPGVLPLPRYDLVLASYRPHSWIELGRDGTGILVFHAFVLDVPDVTAVSLVRVTPDGDVLGEPVQRPWSPDRARLRRRRAEAERRDMDA